MTTNGEERGQPEASSVCRRRPRGRLAVLSLSVGLLAVAAGADICLASGMEAAAHAIGESLPVWTVIPFAGILLSIALVMLMVLVGKRITAADKAA